MNHEATIVVVGGGIAGISCIEALIQEYDEDNPPYKSIILVSESKIIKRVINYEVDGRNLERFNVVEGDMAELFGGSMELPRGLEFKTIVGSVNLIDYSEKNLVIRKNCDSSNHAVHFDMACLCLGSKPRELNVPGPRSSQEVRKRMVVIRDITTVNNLRSKLKDCRRLVIVGNGGISLELVSKISSCEKIWIVRDESVGLPFFDSGAAKFLLDSARGNKNDKTCSNNLVTVTSSLNQRDQTGGFGPALGPNWLQNYKLEGNSGECRELDIIFGDEVFDIVYDNRHEYPLLVTTKTGKQIQCDLVVSAVGVEPNKINIINGHLDLNKPEEGILIDTQMRTSLDGVYAAGDVVSCENWPPNELWFQMRLWTQARQLGFYAGQCIAAHRRNQDPSIYFSFDCFTHCTNFFGHKLVLLGRYNGQSLTEDESKKCEVIARVNPGRDYIKLLLKSGKIVGAVLVGDSGLEETIESLIHDQIDVSDYKEHLLDDTVDIDDYFD